MMYYIVSGVSLLFFWCPCMAINVNVQCNGGLLPNIILLTQCYFRRGTRLNTMKRFYICSLGSHLPGKRFDVFSRLYMDGWRDGLNRLWRDGVTILPRPAKKIATAKNNRPVPALEKKKNTALSRPVEKKKKSHPVPPRKNKQPPRPASEKKTTAPSRLEKKPPRPVPP